MKRSGQIVTFSIKPKDTSSLELVEKYKEYSVQTGIKLSFLILEALKFSLPILVKKKDEKRSKNSRSRTS